MEREKKSRLRSWIKKTVFLLIAVLSPFIIANEIVWWVWLRDYFMNRLLQNDWDLIYSLQPDFHEKVPMFMSLLEPWNEKDFKSELSVNSQGIRASKDIPLPKAENSFRIICLGDSNTFGLDVNDQYTYPAQLERLLNEQAGNANLHFEVINAGIPGYTSRQGLVYLQKRLLQYQPDLVIIGFGCNDAFNRFILGLPPDKKIIRGDIEKGWRKISPFYVLLIFLNRQPLIVGLRHIAGAMVVADLMKIDANKRAINPNYQVPAYDKLDSATLAKFSKSRIPPGDYLENLEQFVSLARKNNFQLLFYIPYRVLPVYRRLDLLIARENQIPVVDFSTRLGTYRLDDLLKNPVYADLMSDYRRLLGDDFLRQNPIYALTSDGCHPNAAANRIISEEMSRAILGYYFRMTPSRGPSPR